MNELISVLRSSPRLKQKRDLKTLWKYLPRTCKVGSEDVFLGDDAAAIKTGDGFLLFAAEGVFPELLMSNPYLAGRTSVLTNVNDIYSMGGRPLAAVDVLFGGDSEVIEQVLSGIRDNASRYNIQIVGGHLTPEAGCPSLSVSMIGKAHKLLSSFNAEAGDDLVFVFNPNGKYDSDFHFWDSSSKLSGEQALAQLEIFPQIAEDEIADTAKDVSMAGIVGSILMLLESSGRGAEIYLDNIPAPFEVPLEEWLLTFPSFGFILSVTPRNRAKVNKRFRKMDLVCDKIGEVTSRSQVFLVDSAGGRRLFWDFEEETLTGLRLGGIKKI